MFNAAHNMVLVRRIEEKTADVSEKQLQKDGKYLKLYRITCDHGRMVFCSK